MLRKIWIDVRSSLWFVPGLLVLGAIVLAVCLVEIDVRFASELERQRWHPLLNTGIDGARGVLAAIAGSMITVTGVAFSVTTVTLSLASTQYTPRILRNFMRDRANQFVLGIFVSVFTYCLVVLRTIRSGTDPNDHGFMPLVSVTVGLLLALLSIGCLIFFIHHIAASIQASSILRAITKETFAAIDKLFPNELGESEDAEKALEELPDATWHPLSSEVNGYVQYVDPAGLLDFAERHDLVVRLARVPGEFVGADEALVFSNQALNDERRGQLRALIVVGEFRTVEQDAGFGIRQIVDIAMKALSPGINDTSTAVSCLDYLGAILSRLATRRIGSPYRRHEGKLRVIAPAPRFADFVAKSFDEIRLFSSSNVSILRQILCTIERILRITKNLPARRILLEHARLAVALADESVAADYDRRRIDGVVVDMRQQLKIEAGDLPGLSVERMAGARG